MASPRMRLALVCVAGLLVATGVAVVADRVAPATHAVTGRASTATAGPSSSAGPATQLATDGVRARWVTKENELPGTEAWRITGVPKAGFIEGFADRTYAKAGEPVRLFVSTSARSFRVEAFRVGYYGGTGARLVWASPSLDGEVQPKCPVTADVNLVSCANWTASGTMQVTEAFPQGDYLLKLIGAENEQSYVPLTVWDPGSHGAYLVKNDVFTWQAWNAYGGYDYYAGRGDCPAGGYPLCSRARVVSFDRPYTEGQGSGEFLGLEAPLVRLLEEHGLDVTYADDLLVQDHPTVLSGHRALLSLGHDECWSLGERTAVAKAEAAGLNVAFFGASGMLRHVRTQPSPLGVDRELVDYRDSAADPLLGKGDPRQVTGNTWGSPPASWPEDEFVGESYNGFLEPGVHAPMTLVDTSAWIYAGTGARDGTRLPDVIASDVDSMEPMFGHPSDVQVLAHSPLSTHQAQPGTRHGDVFYSDMTYYTDARSDAGVWDSGTNNWIPSLEQPCQDTLCSAATVAKMTQNLLWLFGQGPAGRSHPATANWRTYYPTG